ncbi:MAG TPA: DNA-binding protein, partial [Lachnoclostridium sp.]|nr:DNA-binding protein [Lachnoclostridium sp.]
AKGNVYGGHLSRGIIGATCEMVITVIDGVVDRVKDEETGLNIFNFKC